MVETASVMILAGGRAKRMGILCQHRAKSLVSSASNTRVIDFTLSNCIYSQLKDIAVLTDHQRSAMGIYLRRWSLMNDNSGNISALSPTQVTDSLQAKAE